MPFVQTYAVNFANGNLQPYLNLRGWPAMVLSPPTLVQPVPQGLIFKITRGLAAQTPVLNSVYLVPPGGLPLDTRLFMRITFDLPEAKGLSLSGDVHGTLGGDLEPLAVRSKQKSSLHGGEAQPATTLAQPADELSVPEPWAVVLNVGSAPDLLDLNTMVSVTCQFNRARNGVRLNTPGGLQTDNAANLESPLDYDLYQGGYMAFPNNTDGVVDPPIFTLTHSFCGWNNATNRHTAGSGFLKIFRMWQAEVEDHRVYSNNVIPPSATSIQALGMSLVTLSGYGTMSMRLRTFELWLNPGS